MQKVKSQEKYQTKKFVIVLGMHRSGTSMMMNILHEAGFYVSDDNDLMKSTPDNPKGYFERNSVMEANDIILKMAGGTWDDPPDSEDVKSIRIDPLIKSLLECYKDKKQAAIKDPRLCLTFPVWKDLLPPDMKIIRIIRDRESVIKSLVRRDSFTREKAGKLYDKYNSQADHFAEGYENIHINYENLLGEAFKEAVGKIQQFLRIEKKLSSIAKNVIDPKLDHSQVDVKNTHPLVSIVIPVYNQLLYTHECTKSILKNTKYPSFEVLFIDNYSTDGTCEYLIKVNRRTIRHIDFKHSQDKSCDFIINSTKSYMKGEVIVFMESFEGLYPGWLTDILSTHQTDIAKPNTFIRVGNNQNGRIGEQSAEASRLEQQINTVINE